MSAAAPPCNAASAAIAGGAWSRAASAVTRTRTPRLFMAMPNVVDVDHVPKGPACAVVLAAPRRAVLRTLQVRGGRHATRRAHTDHRAAALTARELEQGGSEIANAGHAVRVAERHRAAVDVGDVPWRLELRLVVERGHRVRLVELPQVDIGHGQVMMLQELPDRGCDRD